VSELDLRQRVKARGKAKDLVEHFRISTNKQILKKSTQDMYITIYYLCMLSVVVGKENK
jgi:hypothetical protein